MMKKRQKALLWLGAMAVGLTVALNPVKAQAAGVPIDAAHFPDSTFRQYIAENCDTNKDNILSETEISNVRELDVAFKEIQSVKGVEYFTELTYLECAFNQLKELDISKNINLEYLSCGANSLSKLDVSKNEYLENLFCYGNFLTELDLRNNSALCTLSCSRNELTSLDVSKCLDLSVLFCNDNHLTNLNLRKNEGIIQFNDDPALGYNSSEKYVVVLSEGQKTLDLTTLPGNFNIKYASNWKGGTVEGNILTFTGNTVTYKYNCGKGCYIDVTLDMRKLSNSLSAPVLLEPALSANGVKVSWKPVPGAELYRVMYKIWDGTWKTGGYTTSDSYTVKNLSSGVEYAFTVRCVTADKKNSTSDYDKVGVYMVYIAAPALTSVTNVSNGVKVEWAESAGAELYKVMYKEPGGSYKTAGYTSNTYYTVTGLNAGTEYTFTARCIKADKKTYTSSYDSKGLSIVYNPTVTKLETPVISKLENTASGVKVTWGAVKDAEMYRVLYKEPNGTFKTGGYTTNTSYTVKNLVSGTEYAFTVRCMTADKKVNTSDYDKMGTYITYIAHPVLKKVANTSTGVKVTWEASAGAELYKVMYKTEDGSWKTGGYTTGTSYTVKKLTAGTAYAFTVRCMTADKASYTSSYDKTGLTIVYQP